MLRREQAVCTQGVAALAVLAVAALAGCGTGEKARREAEMAALVKQVDELKKGQDQMTREAGPPGRRAEGPRRPGRLPGGRDQGVRRRSASS